MGQPYFLFIETKYHNNLISTIIYAMKIYKLAFFNTIFIYFLSYCFCSNCIIVTFLIYSSMLYITANIKKLFTKSATYSSVS